MLTKNTTSFLGLKRHGITLAIFLLLFINNSLWAQDVWQKTKIYPGSQKLLSVAASFEEGWERNTQNYSQWFRFSDKQYRSPQTWKQVQPKVTRIYNFTINAPGYLTFVFETHVAKEVFYHQNPRFAIYKLKNNGKWKNMWLGFTVYSKCFHGGKPTVGSNTNLFLYRINTDNTLRYYTVPPLYQPGQYRLVIEAAKRVGAYDLAYVPCRANLQVYFIRKNARVQQGYDKPQLGNYSNGVSHKSSTYEPNGTAPDISGTWKWFDGETIHIYPNGTATDGFKGKWQAKWNGSGFTYTINWNNGQYIDNLTLHENTLDGHNQNGTHVWGKRMLSGNRTSGGLSGDRPFGTANYDEFSLKGNIYYLQANTSRLPDFGVMSPVGSIYTKKLNISNRSFTSGFPGVTNRFEWFGIRYTGTFYVQQGGKHTFRLSSDDGSKLWIDNRLIVNNDGVHPTRSKSGIIYLNPGQHNIQVDYFQGPRTMLALQLFVTPPGGAEKIFSPKYASNQKFVQSGSAQTASLHSGTYRVKQGRWKSTWRLHVYNGRISGTSEWSCCPRHRIDPVRGTISGNSVVIERDCSGQGWNGACRQTYKGTIKGNRITGPCMGTGLNVGDTWVLYLNNKQLRER